MEIQDAKHTRAKVFGGFSEDKGKALYRIYGKNLAFLLQMFYCLPVLFIHAIDE